MGKRRTSSGRSGHGAVPGLVANSAFALVRALPYGEPRLTAAITRTALRWFRSDADYPAAWEPGDADFLSPALTEAELLTPAVVTDPTDGQIAHLHGLNLYRAYAFERLRAALATEDPRQPRLAAASRGHAEASLPAVSGSDYMVEHWLAAYAVLLLA